MKLHPKDRASASPSNPQKISNQHSGFSNTEGNKLTQIRDCERTLLGNLSLPLQIALVANHNDGEVILVLDSQNLLLEGHDLLEALTACDTVDQEETLTRSHILLAHGGVLFLAGGIEDI